MPFTPYDAGMNAIRRARGLLRASRTVKAGTIRADMRRLSVVMAVAALDTYMHRLIVDRAYTHGELPGALARLDVPFERLLAEADRGAEAARSRPHSSRPRVAVKRDLRDRLLRETFQRFQEVSRALAMAGRSGRWDEIAQGFNPPVPTTYLRERLDAIVRRRNQIVHEGDYRRLERPRDTKRNVLT